MTSKITEKCEPIDESPHGERGKEETKSFRTFLKDADTSELLSFSKYTLFGAALVILALIIWFLLMSVQNPHSDEIGLGILSIFSLVFLVGLVVDILRWRDFTEWSAIGVIIAGIGFILIILPLVLNMLPVISEDIFSGLTRGNLLIIPASNLSLYEILIILGVLFVIIGFTSHATEYDQKLKDLLFILGMRIRNFQKREAIKVLLLFILGIITGTLRVIANGLRNIRSRIKQFLGYLKRSFKAFIDLSWGVITKTLPGTIWNNLHWFGLIALFLIFSLPNLKTNNFHIDTSLVIIGLFFFLLGLSVSYQDRVIQVTTRTRNTIFHGIINAYSMLSGSKLKYHQAVYCARCLRGIERKEFKSLQEVKNSLNPLCPFCGYANWIIPSEKVLFKEQISRDIQLIDTEITKSSEVKSPQKVISENIPSTTQPEAVVTRKSVSDVLAEPLSNEVQRNIKNGKFPDYKTYLRAQELGASDFSELELVDRFEAPDFKTALKIREGGFSHYKTFQKAQEIGTSTFYEYQSMESSELEVQDEKIQPTVSKELEPIQQEIDVSTLLEKPISEITTPDELIEAGRRFASSDKECKEWFNWFQTQTARYKKFRVSEGVYKSVVTRFQSFLDQKVRELDLVNAEVTQPEKIIRVTDSEPSDTARGRKTVFYSGLDLENVMQIIEALFADDSKVTGKNRQKWNEYKNWYYQQKRKFLVYGEISSKIFIQQLNSLRRFFISEIGYSQEDLYDLIEVSDLEEGDP